MLLCDHICAISQTNELELFVDNVCLTFLFQFSFAHPLLMIKSCRSIIVNRLHSIAIDHHSKEGGGIYSFM